MGIKIGNAKKRIWLWPWLFLGSLVFFESIPAFAVPTRQEVFRDSQFGIIVYKDSTDANVNWFVPPIEIYEEDGKVVFYKFPKEDRVDYYFYVKPYWTRELQQYVAWKLKGVSNASQLRPVVAKQFGLQVKTFNAAALGDPVTDFQYLGRPQTIKISVEKKLVDEFEFLLAHKPGVQGELILSYDSEKIEKFLRIELKHKEVYDALGIAASGRYQYTRGEIETGVTKYLSQKYIHIQNKGNLQVPNVVNRVIEECFTPIDTRNGTWRRRPGSSGSSGDDWIPWDPGTGGGSGGGGSGGGGTGGDDWVPWDPKGGRTLAPRFDLETRQQLGTLLDENRSAVLGLRALPQFSPHFISFDEPSGPTPEPGPGGTGGGGRRQPGGNPVLLFAFKQELAQSERVFFYNEERLADTTEVAALPFYLTSVPKKERASVQVQALGRKDVIAGASTSALRPQATGIQVAQNEEYIIESVFALQADSPYNDGLHWYRWDPSWPTVDEDLYYRVGQGPWLPVTKRAVVQSDGLFTGELQFYVDRQRIWSKIPSEWKERQLGGLWPARFSYQKTFPQFNIVVTGRKYVVQ